MSEAKAELVKLISEVKQTLMLSQFLTSRKTSASAVGSERKDGQDVESDNFRIC